MLGCDPPPEPAESAGDGSTTQQTSSSIPPASTNDTPPPTQGAFPAQTYFATSTFPYGPSSKQVESTFRLAAENSAMYMVQLDDGVPWAQALSGKPWPGSMERKWADLARRAPKGRPVYLALEPLDQDREALAPAIAGSSTPKAIRGASFDSDAVKQAYRAYVMRAIDRFHPTFLNLGVENGELAHRKPKAWGAYTNLIKHVITAVKRKHPNIKIGISFGLQSLMEPATARRAKGLIAACDYVGLSFYPYMSSFHEKYGAAPLPSPPDEWRKPFAWIRRYTDKPIAITETGYNTKNVDLPKWKIHMRGSEALQRQYVEDLGAYAARDHYLFVVYYIPIDMGPLMDSLPKDQRAFGDMWRDNGLYTERLQPKPALHAWRAILNGNTPAAQSDDQATDSNTASSEPTATTTTTASTTMTSIGFATEADLFQAPQDSRIRVDTDAGAPGGATAMRWRFNSKPGQFAWCVREIPAGALANTTGFTLDARSNHKGPIILQLKESGGEAFFVALNVRRKWRTLQLNLADFKLDPKTRRNGRLQPERITQILLADTGDGAPSGGQRRKVWIANWIVR